MFMKLVMNKVIGEPSKVQQSGKIEGGVSCGETFSFEFKAVKLKRTKETHNTDHCFGLANNYH